MTNSTASNSTPNGILVSDFDGTITRFDFYDLVSREFPEIAGNYWKQYEAGEISHFEALRSIFAGIRAPEGKILEIVKAMQIEPGLAEAVALLETHGWSITVASAGCSWYIECLLLDANVSLDVKANPGSYSLSNGLEMRLPEKSPFFSEHLGVNKVAVVREALRRSSKVAFAGDGRPDLAPALLVRPEMRFAKRWLAKKLVEIGEDFQPFESWQLAFRACGTPVNDFAALLSDATVFQLMASPKGNLEGIRLLATALMLNGVAMEICGSSRPASGSEHLISHALDLINPKPRLHGLQVGVATYLVSQLQKHGTDRIATLFDATGFWDQIRQEPFIKKNWVAAFHSAPSVKPGFYTILSERDYTEDLIRIIENDPRLKGLYV
jgi:2,3-diketo-5-methylthio-1-phosphopentane phosphatase